MFNLSKDMIEHMAGEQQGRNTVCYLYLHCCEVSGRENDIDTGAEALYSFGSWAFIMYIIIDISILFANTPLAPWLITLPAILY